MGVPKFFKYLAERFPMIITPYLGDEGGPPIDNMYLDMNGIIHNCSHGDVDARAASIAEEDMARAMFAYVERLFDAIRPRKRFYMCIDGVAPRAKMNQQRQRRFRAAYDLARARAQATEEGYGDELPDLSQVFDSNMITPGTPFMMQFGRYFRYLVHLKLSTDPAWRNCEVIFSGHDAPGEGEHKILEFMRRRRAQDGYNPNETHCIYGLDADLVMLALASHEQHVVLLREVVKFPAPWERQREEQDRDRGVIKRGLSRSDEFVLFHVPVLRDYLRMEFTEPRNPGELDLVEASLSHPRMCNDFVLMCFFVGNDFMPCVPTLYIQDGALAAMADLYRLRFLASGRYLTTEAGAIDWESVGEMLRCIGEMELAMINAREKDAHDYQCRHYRKSRGWERGEPEPPPQPFLTDSIGEAKERHYQGKLHFAPGDSEAVRALCLRWIEGVEWVWKYYFQGVPSWKWFYDAHYAPFASDVASLDLPAEVRRIRFERGQPFQPFQQLLGVLPPSSIKRCLPEAWHELSDTDGPLGEAFPEEIDIDRSAARAEWEGVVLIPFLREEDIVRETTARDAALTPAERHRNTLGTHELLRYDPYWEGAPTYAGEPGFDPIDCCRVRAEPCSYPDYPKGAGHRPHPLPGVKEIAGFCSLHAKRSYRGERQMCGVTVFGMPSRKESMLIRIAAQPPATAKTAQSGGSEPGARARDWQGLVGQEVWIGWPHMRRALLCGLCDEYETVYETVAEGERRVATERNMGGDTHDHRRTCQQHQMLLLKKLGVETQVTVIAQVRPWSGHTRVGADASYLERLHFPIQMLLQQDEYRPVLRPPLSVGRRPDDFAPGSPVMYLPNKKARDDPAVRELFGRVARVKGVHTEAKHEGRLILRLQPLPPPVELPPELQRALAARWTPYGALAAQLNLSGGQLSMLCGSVCTSEAYGRQEIGLCVALNQQGLARVGYARAVPQALGKGAISRDPTFYVNYGGRGCIMAKLGQRGPGGGHASVVQDFRKRQWVYSEQGCELVRRFCREFPVLVDALSSGTVQPNNFDPHMLRNGKWRDTPAEVIVERISSWVRQQAHWQAPLVDAEDETMPQALLAELERCAEAAAGKEPTPARNVRSVRRYDAFAPLMQVDDGGCTVTLPALPPPDTSRELRVGSRVACMRGTGGVSFGARGTVVSLLSDQLSAEVLMDRPLATGSKWGGRLTTCRGAVLRRRDLANLDLADSDGPGEQLKQVTDVCSLRQGLKECSERVADVLEAEQRRPSPGTPYTPGDSPRRRRTPPRPARVLARGERLGGGRGAGAPVPSPVPRAGEPAGRGKGGPAAAPAAPEYGAQGVLRTRRPSPQRMPSPEPGGRGRGQPTERPSAPAAPAGGGRGHPGSATPPTHSRLTPSPKGSGSGDAMCLPSTIAHRMGVPFLGAGSRGSATSPSPRRGSGGRAAAGHDRSPPRSDGAAAAAAGDDDRVHSQPQREAQLQRAQPAPGGGGPSAAPPAAHPAAPGEVGAAATAQSSEAPRWNPGEFLCAAWDFQRERGGEGFTLEDMLRHPHSAKHVFVPPQLG